MAHLRASATEEELVEAVQATAEDTASDLVELADYEAQAIQAIAMLEARGKGAYKQALAALREETAGWWQEVLERDVGEETYSPNAADLLRFLQEEACPWYDRKREEWERRPLLRSQALGEAFELRQLEGVARYDPDHFMGSGQEPGHGSPDRADRAGRHAGSRSLGGRWQPPSAAGLDACEASRPVGEQLRL